MSGTASQDLLRLLPILCPTVRSRNLTYETLMSLVEKSECKTVHYCTICNTKFPNDPNVFRCQNNGCHEFRYKGSLSSQQKSNRQPRSSFVLADIKVQLRCLLERKGIWLSIQQLKNRINEGNHQHKLTDITDGQNYRYFCEPGQFLHNSSNISAVFNTDGIPLYTSSNVKLWPIFLAINELPPGSRYARENMILAAIWQGKNKPPFQQYLSAFGEEISMLYHQGFVINPKDISGSPIVKTAVILATMDLQAKAYALNMTMHNGQNGCSTCEEEGKSVKQGKGHARCYPYKVPEKRANIRDSDDIKNVKGLNATPQRRIQGICGKTGLFSLPEFDVVLGVVPDYMHGILLGISKTLLYKFFSPTNSGKPYFVGKHLKSISKRLQSICPPDYVERMPRDLEKHFSHFKATELQSWLLFYAIPCLNGYLDELYLSHLSLLSESTHILLGDSISDTDLQRAEELLNSFYQQFTTLYEEGTCGLNVHNVGAHLVFFVRMWGPLWAWSCFAFEDWNAALLQGVHGTGDVTMQCIRMKQIQLKLSSVTLDDVPPGAASAYLSKFNKQTSKMWSSTTSVGAVIIGGSLQALDNEDNMEQILTECESSDKQSMKKALRVIFNGQKLYAQEYSRMQKRVCYMVKKDTGEIRQILYFLINMKSTAVFAYTKKFDVHAESFVCGNGPQHIIRVVGTDDVEIISIDKIVEKVFYMNIDGLSYVACMPNMVGHSVFK